MKKVKLLSIASTMLIGSSLSIQAPVAEASIMSGANCESANLTQALAGMGWSQRGVANNATSPFFTVCGVTWNFGEILGSVNAIGVFPSTSGAIECTLRAQDWLTGAFTSAAFTINPGNLSPERGQSGADVPFVNGPNVTIVCALDPGEILEGYWIDALPI